MSDIVILGFDTSTSTLSTALYNKGHRSETLIECGDKQSTSQQSSMLIPTLGALLEQANLRYDQVNYFAVTRGPGSFTGIRIGLATAQGLHLATQIPCFAPTSLRVLAFQGQQQAPTATSFLALIDNKRGQFYGQIFNTDTSEKEPARIWATDDLQAYLEQSHDHYLVSYSTPSIRHCERSEAIQEQPHQSVAPGLLRSARNDGWDVLYNFKSFNTQLARCLVPQTSLATGLIDLLLFLDNKRESLEQDLSPFYLVNPVYAKSKPSTNSAE
ncbi:MAG: tRNA (adenosine(37)-N6)-threonylcarbamoyltransferase complex dimerization subunit type 1 TsaB [Alphaproteobacteria bacterium]